MRPTSRTKLGIGLVLALAATALSGPSVLAFPAPADTTVQEEDSIRPPAPEPPSHWLPHQVPPIESPLEVASSQPDQSGTWIERSPETGRYVRVPAL